MIREANQSDTAEICAVINDGATVYKGVIPDDGWHEPYMPIHELHSELAAGVRFSCYTEAGRILGVMGAQDKGLVVLIRHAYIRTAARRRGIGTELLAAFVRKAEEPILIGTWKAAQWARASRPGKWKRQSSLRTNDVSPTHRSCEERVT